MAACGGKGLFYHASDSVIDWPDPRKCVSCYPATIEGTPIIALFANSQGAELIEYGRYLYQFTLKKSAKTRLISNKIYLLLRLSRHYRAGLIDLARRENIAALYRTHFDKSTSLIVIDFKAFETWGLVE